MESSTRLFAGSAGVPVGTWEVGAVRLNLWLPRRDREPYRPWVVLCRRAGSRGSVTSDFGDGDSLPELVRNVLRQAAAQWQSQPAQVEVADTELAGILETLLAGTGVPVEVNLDLPALRRRLKELVLRATPDDPTPGPLAGAGVTLEQLAAFTSAAAELFAGPWGLLSFGDWVRVEAPEVEEGLRWFSLEDRGGRPRLVFATNPESAPEEWMEDWDDEDGDGEEEDREDEDWDEEDWEEDSEEDEERWLVELGHPWELPLSDLELWERHGLPWIGEKLAPVARFFSWDDVERPDARQLAFLEGLLRALARMTEEKLDAGPWEEEVPTFQGPLRLVLSLPHLPSPEELEAPGDGTPAERVAALMERARWAPGREAIQLARRALEIWPDCAEAYVLLAERTKERESSRRLFAEGVAAGERALGPEVLDAPGQLWERVEACPYLQALLGLAQALVDLDQREEAATHFRALLRHDPDDHLGARRPFANLLLELGRDDEAEEVLAPCPDELLLADVVYLKALVAFRREGDSPEARRRLRSALKLNPSFPLFLFSNLNFVPRFRAGDSVLGGADEIVAWFGRYQTPWSNTPGALEWLAERSEVEEKTGGKRPKAKKGKKRR
jgi:tetratricopeptide (TPR) repeat protein